MPEPDFDTLLIPSERRRKHAVPAHAVEEYHHRETPVVTPTSALAVISMILGIGVFVTLGFTGLPAVLLGHFAWSETSTGDRGGHGMTVAGLLFGYLAVIAWVAAIVFIATVGQDIRMPHFPIPTTTSITSN